MSRRSPRICIAAPQVPFARGGAELHVELLASALRGAGYKVDVLTVPFRWKPTLEVIDQAMAWRLLSLEGNLDGPGSSIDLVIATKFPSYLVRHPNKVAWVFHQQREVYDLHGTPFGPFSMSDEDSALRRSILDLDYLGLGEATEVFANSRNVAARLERFCGIKAEALYAPPPLNGRLHPGPFEDYVFFVGRLDKIKRVDLTLEALARTKTPVRLVVAGSGPERAPLEDRSRQLGLDGRVEFLGFIDNEELIDRMSRALAVVLTPHDEDYGFTTIEACLAAKPVIATEDAGGVLEFVVDGETGCVVPSDPDAIADRIDHLYSDRDLCRRLGSRGQDIVRQRVNWQRAVAALTRTLERARSA